MTDERDIRLVFLRYDGKQEKVELNQRTLADAEAVADNVFHIAPGLYVQVELYIHGISVETIRNDLPTVGR